MIPHLFVTGLPRSGTTLLYRLLACDEESFRAPAFWEIFGGAGTVDERRSFAERLLPEIAGMVGRFHPIDNLNVPEDCDEWFCGGIPDLLEKARRLLDLAEGKRLLLKSPDLALLDWPEDMNVVIVDRRLGDCIASATELYSYLSTGTADFVEPYMFKVYGRLSAQRIAVNARSVRYRDLVRDPIDTVCSIHSASELAKDRMREWVEKFHLPWLERRKERQCSKRFVSSQDCSLPLSPPLEQA